MVIVKTIRGGDLLKAEERYIAQQCNCVTVKAHDLSQYIADRYPYADVYGSRRPISKTRNCASKSAMPGTIQICSSSIKSKEEEPNVICMFAQYAPGKPGAYSRYYESEYDEDNEENRLRWFQTCLDEIEKTGIKRIAMPYFIGCGLAGGDWAKYREKLERAKTEIILYQKN
jgi:hypothetical protein